MSGWTIALRDPRQDSATPETNQATADRLGMAPRATVEQTLAAYVRGEDGKDPRDQGYRIDPVLRAIAAHHGIVPLRLLRANHLGLGFGVTLSHGDDGQALTHFHDEYAPDIGGIAQITAGIAYASSLVEDPRVTIEHAVTGHIPTVLRSALEGRTLGDLVLIPGLHRQPAITKVDQFDDFDRLAVERMESVPLAA